MNKNTVLAYATLIMTAFGLALIALGVFYYTNTTFGFCVIGAGFLAMAWVFDSLKGRI